MADALDDKERQMRRMAFLLLKKADERRFTPIGREAATQLMAEIIHVPAGQGSFNLVVPKDALVTAGIDPEIWRKAELREVHYKEKDGFEVPALFGDIGLLPVLTILGQGVEKEMMELAKRHGSGQSHSK
jgi:hypothetical protein